MRTNSNRLPRHASTFAATMLLALPFAVAGDLGTTGGDLGTDGPARGDAVDRTPDRIDLPPAIWNVDPLGDGAPFIDRTEDSAGDRCLGDVDRSGEVDFEDFLYVLVYQGSEYLALDLDESGMVDFADLLHVITNQGCRGDSPSD